MRIVIALGGNALLRRSDPMTTEVQRKNIEIAARAIAPLAGEHSVVVVHGNGPQVGLLSLQAEAYTGAEPYPLDVLDAGTQGMIGWISTMLCGSGEGTTRRHLSPSCRNDQPFSPASWSAASLA